MKRKELSIEEVIKKASIVVLSTASVFTLIVFFFYIYAFNGELSPDQTVWAEFGDFFGGTLNPLLAFLSLIAILSTLLVQTRELSHSTKALQEQSNHLQTQAFENTFFSLIAIHNENIRTLDLEDSEEQTVRGRAVFRVLYERLREAYEIDRRSNQTSDEGQILKSAYHRFYKKSQKFHGHYLRAVKKIVDYVDHRCPLDREEYWEIIKAQLSDYELLLIFYHSFYDDFYLEIEALGSKGTFEHIPVDDLLNSESHKKFLKGVDK